MSSDLYEGPVRSHAGTVPATIPAEMFLPARESVGMGVAVALEQAVAARARPHPVRDPLSDRRVLTTPAPAGLGLDLQAGSTPWPTLLDRVTLLSAREMEVLLLLGTGASNRTIAGRLKVAERTVKAHVAQVMAKLVVESRLQAGLVSLVFQLVCEGSLPLASPNRGGRPAGDASG